MRFMNGAHNNHDATIDLPISALRIALVGPLPPSSGGMANQTLQLSQLLRNDGMTVELVQVNRPYHPWVAQLKGLRALFRLFPYMTQLWQVCGKVDLIHIMANSGWSWHLFAAPAVWIAHLRGTPVVINYRGGEAASFFEKAFSWVKPSLDKASAIVVPSGFLEVIFNKYGFIPKIVPNIIDFSRFFSLNTDIDPAWTQAPRLLVARNLELIYDNATAVQAFKIIHDAVPRAHLTIAGTGPELARLQDLTRTLGIAEAVTFTGRIDNTDMPKLYHSADIMLNPTLADNMPISILESLASGVPVVSTDVGGIPFLVQHELTAMLVPVQNPLAMANAVLTLLRQPEQVAALRKAGVELVSQYTWPHVRKRLMAVYAGVLACNIIDTDQPPKGEPA
jgi:L-malate glycosyltransferase